MNTTEDIDDILQEVVTLPSLPDTVMQITQLINDPDASMSDIGKAISGDPSISLKSLRVVNSAYFALPTKVTSVEHAISLLGMKVIKNIVFTASVFDTLQGGEEMLIKHNVACGIAMKLLVDSEYVDSSGFKHPDEAFIYGLLHDVGKLILGEFMAEKMARVADLCSTNPLTWSQAEKEIVGVDHAEMGARLAQQWQLSPELIDAIKGHHNLDKCENPDHRFTAALMGLADHICYESGYPAHALATTTLDENVWSETGISPEAMDGFVMSMHQSVDSINELANMAT